MIIVRFPDAATERRALGFLAGRFAYTTSATGETLVPEASLPVMAAEGIQFQVGPMFTSEASGQPNA